MNCLSSHADTMATILATNKARIPDMSTLVESKAVSCLKKSKKKHPENLTNANLEALRTQILQCYNSFLRLSPKNQFHNVSLLVFKFCRTTKAHPYSLIKTYQKLQQAKSTHQILFLSVLLPLRSIQWSLFDFAQRCFCESHLISQTCYRPKQEKKAHSRQ